MDKTKIEIPYVKMHGCHNVYLYVNNLNSTFESFSTNDWAEISKKYSDPEGGIGADGLIVVHKPASPKNAARMQMFNADGSEGKMCGNGIRCVAKLLHENLGARESFLIETLAGVRECFVVDYYHPERFVVRVNMGRPSFLPSSIPVDFEDMMVMNEEFEVDDRVFKISCLSMGNPHCVIFVDDLEKFPVHQYGPLIEKNPAFPEGVNVEFVEKRDSELFQRTWERGSGETQACGTGACAVGVVTMMSGQMKSPVTVHLRGGDLTIVWDGLHDVWMTGEAVTSSSGTITWPK